MRFPRNLIPELVPSGLPPDRFLDGVVNELASSIEDQLLRRSYLWSIAIMNAGFASRLPIPGGLTCYSTGFVYISNENALQHRGIRCISGFSYGASILIESEEPHPQVILPLEIDNRVFPVAVNFGLIEEHGLPTHPHTGTGTCWVANQNPAGRWQKGILTCRHTLASFPRHSAVSLFPSVDHSSPRDGIVANITCCTIDAAIVEVSVFRWPNGLLNLPICNPIAPGQSVFFSGRSTAGSGSVLRVFQHPHYFGNLFGQRIFTDCFGVAGDSGSLFRDPILNKGLGIYMGTVPDGSAGREGICQHLSQASQFFEFSTLL